MCIKLDDKISSTPATLICGSFDEWLKKKIGIFRKHTPDTVCTYFSDRVCYHMPIIIWGVRQEFISPSSFVTRFFS